jgi:hypothetical protein
LAVSLVGTCKQLNAIGSFCGMITHESDRLFRGLGVLDEDMILAEEIANINRHNRPDGLPDCEHTWAAQFATLDAAAPRESIVQQ